MGCLPYINLLLLIAVLPGCVRRELTVTTDPPGALVWLNGQEAGRTPFTTEFEWYGTYTVEIRRDGSEPLITTHPVKAPWWQYVPFDFLAELAPWRPVDRQIMSFDLKPASADTPDAQQLIRRGLELQRQAGQ